MPFSPVRFTGTWRPYQARVLAALAAHVDDGRVHLVAPPGSGKTLLGLETVVRLGRPALVLAPTLALRDQWLQRFSELFEGDAATSTDPQAPADLTVVTYQGLHVAARDCGDALLAALRERGVGTLVVDEAHHLRNAWWRTLRAVRAGLDDATTVALTATPPYDVPPAEWNRYAGFCGPPDADISVPELVRAGHLCPHLDLVRYALPAADEQTRLDAFRRDTQSVVDEVVAGAEWLGALRRHPWIAEPQAHAQAIVDGGPEWFVAALAVLREATDADLAAAAAVLDMAPADVPALRTSLLDTFLTGVVNDHHEAFDAHLGPNAVRDLRRRLDRLGAVDGSRVALQHPPSVQKALAASASKLDAAVETIRVESQARGDGLRAVVLADRIRDAAWDPDRGAAALDALGVVPLFERLRQSGVAAPLGVLTGRLAVVPVEALGALREAAGAVEAEPLAVAPGYARMTGAEGALVRPMTALFQAGVIRVLVGTVALLGEGWDAPSANVLVSASAAATFVRTGQIRGRVFRTDPAQPDKVSSVWHLAVLDPTDPDGGASVEALRRRFRAFVVPRPGDPPTLETGLADVPPARPDAVRQSNAEADERAQDHATTRDHWRRAVGEDIDGAELRPVVRLAAAPAGLSSVRVRVEPRYRRGWSLAGDVAGLAGLAGAGSAVWVGLGSAVGLALGGVGLALVAVGGGLVALDKRKRARRAEALGPDGLAVGAAARVVLDALRQAHQVIDPDAVVQTERTGDRLEAWLDGRVATDADVFSQSLGELLSPVGSPRYLLQIETGARLAVPDALGSHKRCAGAFAEAWRHHVGPAELVFTRTPPGRRALAAARARSAGEQGVERVRRWSTPPGR